MRAFVAVLLLVCVPGIALAQKSPSAPHFIDRSDGEEDQIRLRNEWFYEPRRAGTASDREMAELRLAAVRETRVALGQQRSRQARGYEATQNIWAEKGPSPSTFGGWAFGTVSGRIQAIEADWSTGTLYIGATAGGVWKSTNDGLSWTSIFDSAGTLAVGAIEVDPNDSDVIWVGTGDNIVGCESYFGIGLLRSPDRGQTWELRNGSGAFTLSDLTSFASITVDPRDSDTIVAGGRLRGCTSGNAQPGGIYTTVDGGQSWIVRLPNIEIHEIVRDPSNPDVLWSSTANGVFKSTDNGVGWTLQTNSGLPSGSLGRTELAVAPSDPDTVYVLYDTPSDQFWRTTDGGANWQMMTADACDGQCSYNMAIRVHPTNPDVVYRGTVRIFKTINGGSSWSVLTNSWGGSQQVHQDTHALLVDPFNPEAFYVSGDGGLWKSENGGASFLNLNGNLSLTQFYAIDVDAGDPERICGGAQDNSSLARDGDNVWALQAVTGDGFVCAIHPTDPNVAYITSYPSGGYPNVWRSTSGLYGSFGDISGSGSGIIGGDRLGWVTPYTMDKSSPNILYLGTHRAYRSTNGGTSWTQVGPTNLTNNGGDVVRALEINRSFPSYVFSGASSGAVYVSTNDGAVWTDITPGLPLRAINDIAADPTNPDRAFAVVSGFNTNHLWEWNNGSGWTPRGGGLPNVPANTVLMLSDQDILVGVDTGVFRSTDGGQSFLPFMAGMPEGMVVTDLKYNEAQSIVTAGTYGRGAWQVEVGAVQPILLPESLEQPLIEIDGDGDARIEPGETWSARPILRNVGGVTATAVTARLGSSTPGIDVITPQGTFGDLSPGVPTPSLTAFQFTVDPDFDCGTSLAFDLLDIESPTPPGVYPDRTGIYSAIVQDGTADPIVTAVVDDDFDPTPGPGWIHLVGDPGIPDCEAMTYSDDWNLSSKDAGHGVSYHAGSGPGSTYSRSSFSWLHPLGKDSTGGPGFDIPLDAIGATLSVVHWYDANPGRDGGQLAIDIQEDAVDSYETIDPVGGYPATLATGGCNGLGGKAAFSGSSGGWVTSQFDLTPYRGSRIWLAFVFGSVRQAPSHEGWYIDDVQIAYQDLGPPTCDVARWPGVVPSAHFSRTASGMIEATWTDSCSIVDFPAQTYSIQSGDLDLLAGGQYSHVPVEGSCDRSSGAQFEPGTGDEYYLVVPVGEGREGGNRPQVVTTCGVSRSDCD